MTNRADLDQLASSEAQTDLDLHCLLQQGLSCSAREGLTVSYFSTNIISRRTTKSTISPMRQAKTGQPADPTSIARVFAFLSLDCLEAA